MRAKITAVLLQLEVARELTTDPRLRAHLDAALVAAKATAALVERRR